MIALDRYSRPLLLILILVGFGLRLHRLDDSPFRGDEAFTAQYWSLPLDQSLTQIATIEPHPALTYASYHLWGRWVGTDEFTLRLFPALVSLLAIPALYGIGRRLGGVGAGLLAAFLWLIQPYELWHAQDARNYALWAAFSAVGLWLGLIALQRNRTGDWLRYGLAVTVAANLFYNEWFTLIGFGLYVLLAYQRDWSRLWRWTLAAGVAFVSSGLSFVLLQLPLLGRGDYGGTASGFDPALLPSLLTTLVFGRGLPSEWIMPAFAGIILFLIVVVLNRLSGSPSPVTRLLNNLGFPAAKGSRKERGLGGEVLSLPPHPQETDSVEGRVVMWLLCVGVVPIALLSIASLRLRIFAPQYVLAAVPGLVVPLALIVMGGRWRPIQAVAGVVMIGYIGLSLVSLSNYFNDPAYRKAANWPPVTQYLAQQAAADDLVIQQSIDAAFGYYYQATALDIALPASPSQPISEVECALDSYRAQHLSIWLVGQPYPDWPNGGSVQVWLDANWQRVFDQWADGIHVQRYQAWEVGEAELAGLARVGSFDGLTDVRAAQVILPIAPGGDLTVWLYWQPTAQSAAPLRVFVHLIGPTNPATGTPLWSQDDGPPQDGRISTDTWTVGALYRDVYQVPLIGIPAGSYELHVGFYDPVSGARITRNTGGSLLVGMIELP